MPLAGCPLGRIISLKASSPLLEPIGHEDHAHRRLSRRAAACTRGATSGPAGSPSRCLTARSWRSRPTRDSRATARSVRWDRSICRPTRQGARTGIAELGPHLLGEDPRQLAPAEPADGRRAARPPVCEVGPRHGVLGYPRQGDRSAGLRAPGRALRRRLRALSRDLPGGARGDGAARGRVSRRRLSPVPAQGRR